MIKSNGSSQQSSSRQRVLVNVILDKSGSMNTKVQDVIGGFNLYISELAKEPAVEYGFTLTLFDTAVAMKYNSVPLEKVAKLDESSYRPSGNTALLDAIGNTAQTVNTDGFDKIITVIMTDGEENSSREWTLQGIRELVRSKESLGNWTFVFLGANLDAFTQGANLGVARPNAVRYDADNFFAVYDSLARRTNAMSSGPKRSDCDFFGGENPGIKKSSQGRRFPSTGECP
jgi:uncharacterized protein YegL